MIIRRGDDMTVKRLWYSFRLFLIRGSGARADFIRAKNLFASVGKNCSIQKRKLPLYANLVKLGDNVHLASGVSFITHDITHLMLNRIDRVKQAGGVQERVGCIEIGDNVFIGASARIMYDTKIGSNVIIGAGATVTKDIPSNSVVVGTPARVIGSFDDFVDKRLAAEKIPAELLPKHQMVSEKLAKQLWEQFEKKHG